MTTTLTTGDRVSHELAFAGMHRTTLCGKVFVAWIERGAKHGPWHGIEEPLPELRRGRQVDCMACIAARTA